MLIVFVPVEEDDQKVDEEVALEKEDSDIDGADEGMEEDDSNIQQIEENEISNGTQNSNPVLKSTNSDNEIIISDDDDEEMDQDVPSAQNTNGSAEPHKNQISTENKNFKEEITIDDDEEEDEEDDVKEENVEDSSAKNNDENVAPKLNDELLGFPSIFKDVISIGQCLAIDKKAKSDIDIEKDCSILDCPSQVVPLIIKKSNKFPAKLKVEKEDVAKSAAVTTHQNTKNMLTISDFYSSSVGKFLLGIGLSRVKQWYHKDAINKVKKQIRKEGEAEDLMEELKKQQDYLASCRTANASYIFPTEKCESCDFRSEFKLILNNHLNYPHMTPRKEFKCNYCQFATRDSKVIVNHVGALHQKKCLIELNPQLYECPICPYDSGVKSKAATHISKCFKFFVPEKLLVIKDDYFPTITPKPITQEDIKIYEATLNALRVAALNPQSKYPPIPGLPSGLQQQMLSNQQPLRPGMAKSKYANKKVNPLLNQIKNASTPTNQLYQMLSNGQFVNNSSLSGNNNFSVNASSIIKQQQMMAKLGMAALPTNAGAVNPRPGHLNNSKSNKSQTQSGVASRSGDSGNLKGSFVMCEICDGYIKDLEQLRTHMQWIHKVCT